MVAHLRRCWSSSSSQLTCAYYCVNWGVCGWLVHPGDSTLRSLVRLLRWFAALDRQARLRVPTQFIIPFKLVADQAVNATLSNVVRHRSPFTLSKHFVFSSMMAQYPSLLPNVRCMLMQVCHLCDAISARFLPLSPSWPPQVYLSLIPWMEGRADTEWIHKKLRLDLFPTLLVDCAFWPVCMYGHAY